MIEAFETVSSPSCSVQVIDDLGKVVSEDAKYPNGEYLENAEF